MRQMLSLLLAVCMLAGLTACGTQEPQPTGDQVTITIPMEVEGDKSDREIRRDAKGQGIDVTIDHDKETVTYRMTTVQQNDLLLGFKNQFEEGLADGSVRDEYPFVEDVDYNDDMSSLRVLCTRSLYDSDGARRYAYDLFGRSITYQLYSGKAQDDVAVDIVFVDAANNEDLYATNLRDAYAEMRNGADQAPTTEG